MREFNETDFEIEKEELVYDSFFKIKKLTLKHKLFEGGNSQSITRELLTGKSTVAVLLYDIKKDKIALVQQFRVGAIKENKNPWLFEIIAGLIDNGDSAVDTAIRESKEEANVDIKHLIPMHKYLSSPGGSQGVVEIFLGLIDIDNSTEGVYGLEHEHEDIKVHVVTRQKAVEMLNSGKLNNSISIIAMQWLQLNLEQVKKDYQSSSK